MNNSELLRHFWILVLVVSASNAFVCWNRVKGEIRDRPELARGYGQLLRGWLFFGSLPWLTIAVGIELGGVPRMDSYFRPGEGNPYVLAFHAVVIGLWLLGFSWLFLGKGAEFLSAHSGFMKGKPKTAAQIAWGYLFLVTGGVIAMLSMWVCDWRVPR